MTPQPSIVPLPEVSPGVKRVLVRGVPMFFVVVPKAVSPTGKRQRRYFREHDDAKALVKKMAKQTAIGAKSLATLSAQEAARVTRLLERAGSIDELEEALDGRTDVKEAIQRKTVESVTTEMIALKVSAGMRRSYTNKLASHLGQFGDVFGRRVISTITGQQIEEWLYGGGWAPATQRTHLIDVGTLFSFAVKRGYVARNPVAQVERPRFDEKAPGILSVDDCKALVAACAKVDPKFLPYLGLCLFAGVRPSEAKQVSWSDVREDYIVINAKASKTRDQRLLEITPALRRCLIRSGELPAINSVKRMLAIREAANLKDWPRDCLRHSFVTYAMPVKGSTWTVEQAGHSLSVSLKHYRSLASKADCEAFWSIIP